MQQLVSPEANTQFLKQHCWVETNGREEEGASERNPKRHFVIKKVYVNSNREEWKELVKEGCKYAIMKEKEIAGKDRFLICEENELREL